MDQNKKLGRGLEALIPKVAMPASEKEGVSEVNIENIKPNPFQPRKEFNPEKLQELVNSIKEKGILEPIILRNKGSYFEIISGERRYRSAIIAGLKRVPAVMRAANDDEMLEIALIENLHREGLNAIEEAEGYKVLIDRFSFTQEQLSKKISKDRATIANALRLLNLEKEIRDYISKEMMSAGHGRTIVSVEDKNTRLIIAKRIVNQGLSVRQTEEIVKKLKNQNVKPKTKGKEKDVNIIDLEDELMEIFGSKVKITQAAKGGKIEIVFYSEEDFERILEKIRRSK